MDETSKTRSRAVVVLWVFGFLALVFGYLVLKPDEKQADALPSPQTASSNSPDTSSVDAHEQHERTASTKANIDRLRSLTKGLQLATKRADKTADAISSNSDEERLVSPLPKIASFAQSSSDTDTQSHALNPSDFRRQNNSPNEKVIESLKRMGSVENRSRITEILKKHIFADRDTAKETE